MSFIEGSYQWNRSSENSIIQDFDPDTNGNQTVNNNFSRLSGIGGLSENGVIYGFSIGAYASSIEQITLNFTNIPSGRYGLSLYVFSIFGAFIGKFVIISKSLDATSITIPEIGGFNDVRILVTMFDEVTGVPIDAVTSYKVVLRSRF